MPDSLDKKNIGLELEVTPFQVDDSGQLSVADIVNERLMGSYDLLYANSLCRCSPFKPDQKLEVPRLISESGGTVTFEPGGQIEYSSSETASLNDVILELITNLSDLEQVLSRQGTSFFFGSLNPWQSVEEVGLKMRKARYRAMDLYFQKIGPTGQQMMRLSTSLQVNLDFGSPETAKKRWLAANLLSPVFCAVFGNSPFIGGETTGLKSYRTEIWRQLDRGRTGFPHLRIKDGTEMSYVQQYLEFALDACLFMLPDESGCPGYRENGITFRRWLEEGYNGYYPSIEDWEIHLTTLFPDVRPKGFLECRFIDGQSKPCWAVPAILATAILYDEGSTDAIIEALSGNLMELDTMAGSAARKGVSAFPEICRQVFEIGLNGKQYAVDTTLLEYVERFYKHYTFQTMNPADELLEINDQQVFSSAQYADYEAGVFDAIQPPETVATMDSRKLATLCDC